MENQTETTPLDQTSDAQTVLAPDPFDEGSWVEKPEQAEASQTEIPTEQKQETVSQETKQEEEIFDADEYLKRELGFDNWDAAKNEFAELKKLRESAKTPEEIKFANDESKKFFEYAKDESKRRELYNLLDEQFKIEKVISKEVTDANVAAELIKLKMQFENKDKGLSPEDVEFLFNQQYSFPSKPIQSELQTDDEYNEQVREWQNHVDILTRKMMIEAKLAKPELSKYKQELVLPDINKPTNETQQGVSQEELTALRNAYIQSLDGALKDFNGYNVTALIGNNGEVKLPISYTVTNEEKTAQKAMLEGFNMDAYLEKRWLHEDGKHNSKQLADDIYLLENKDKVFQKIANDAASKALENYLKSKSNTNINGRTGTGTFNPDAKTIYQKQVDAIWDA